VGDACSPGAALSGIHATYRKDHYLPESSYNEQGDLPLDGGRFHLAAVAAVGGDVVDVRINGTSVTDLLVEPLLEWYHVWPDPVVAGEPVWVAFHSRNPDWDSATQGQIAVETTAGLAVDGPFPVQETLVPLTYVTVTEDLGTMLLHLRNTDTVSHTISRIALNGREVIGAGACLADALIGPGEPRLVTVPRCDLVEPGEAWTVVVGFTDAPASVGVGRVLRPHFPVESWPKGGDCPLPGGNETAFDRHVAAGFDTTYMYWGAGGCGYSPADLVNATLPALGDQHVLVGDDFLHFPSPETLITDPSAVAGFLTGDESDGQVYVGGVPQAEIKAADARRLWSMYPELTVYNGAKTNKNVGAFAGMADVQGHDFYVAACAPHITVWGTHPPIRGAHDYLHNARLNHMPGTTWFYAQGLHSGWNKSGVLGTVHVQPDPQEILLQAFSVLTAGGKGIMWFQTELAEADHAPPRWQAISDANWMIRAVRSFVREGDLTGGAASDADTLVELIRSRRALIVPIVNLKATSSPTDAGCGAAFLTESLVPHWILEERDVDVALTVPRDFGVLEVFEVGPSSSVDLAWGSVVNGRTLTLQGVPLGNGQASPGAGRPTVRLVVLAADAQVRVEIDAILAAAP
jgi:hypothetical protein